MLDERLKMNLENYSYVNLPSKTGNLIIDIKNLLISNNKTEIFNHAESVAKTNIYIARKYNLDENICELSGYLHDISCIIKPADMLAYAVGNNLYIDEAERKYPFLLHQRISKLISEKYFGINNLKILSAVECHTTLKEKPSSYDMALFIADKLSWDQSETPPFYNLLSDALEVSLQKASLEYMDYMIDKGLLLFPHKWFNEGRKYLHNNLKD